jgi:hypothetical protein
MENFTATEIKKIIWKIGLIYVSRAYEASSPPPPTGSLQ